MISTEYLRKISVSRSCTVRKVMTVLQEYSMRLVLVTDEKGCLEGVISDGDIRRALLSNISLEDSAQKIMNTQPVVVTEDISRELVAQLFREKKINRIPVVDANGIVKGLIKLETIFSMHKYDNPVVIMAGGLGSRLSPLTDNIPKAMLSIGGKPILETIIESCIHQGFDNFYLSVNYKSDQIMDHFKNGSQWGVSIKYLEEKERLGTAGSLSLITESQQKPIIVMNGDLLTKVNLCSLLDYHTQEKSLGTMCVKEYEFQVPYGVVCESEGQITEIKEKPFHSFLVNAGIYVLSPEVLSTIPASAYYDMTSLFQDLRKSDKKTMVFPIHEYWLDIGKMQDYEKAQNEFLRIFDKKLVKE